MALPKAMNRSATVPGIALVLATAALGLGIAVERRACEKLANENHALRAQLAPMELPTTESRGASNLIAPVYAASSQSPDLADNETEELVRLRAEVSTLRQQCREIETLREDTRKVRSARRTGLNPQSHGQGGNPGESSANGLQFEILRAEYGTARTNLDVTDELAERIRGDRLKAVASNSLKGDPEFGQVKNLTVIYRFGGVTRTNQFREGDLIVLPAE